MSRVLKPARRLSGAIKATTMSVILRDSDTTSVYVEVQGESANLTLRFDRGQRAVLCGYPQLWLVHDVPVEAYNSESMTGAELFEADGVMSEVYVSAETERAILIKLKRSVMRQFNDEAWASMRPNKRRQQSILNKISRAIEALKETT